MSENTLNLAPGGIPLAQLAEQFGSPLYVYDADKIATQYKRLTQAFEGTHVRFHYACKANTNLNILKFIAGLGAGLDAVSIQEVQLGIRAGYDPKDILYTPNSVGMNEISEAIVLGVRINVDNLSVLEALGHEYGSSVPVGIRINPHIVGGGHGNIQTGHIDSKFGISIHQLRHVLRVVNNYGLKIEGLHMHTGSDILDADVFLAAAEVMYQAASEFPDLAYLDFGSGFKVAYKDEDVTTDIELLGQRLGDSFRSFCQEYGRPLELKFEPGKFLVSEAGWLLVRANVVKHTVSTVFVGVDSGQNHLLRPMFYQAYHRILNVSRPEGRPRVYSVVGYICETDTLGWDRRLAEVAEGDVLAIANAGAYGFSMSSNYNSRPRPAEVLVLDGKAHLIRRRETLDDLLATTLQML